MKEHFQDYGVRRWAGDDLIELQGEPLEAIQRLVEPYAPCILQGCGLNREENRIEPGLVALWKMGPDKVRECVKIARFGGCPAHTLPVYLTLECRPEERVYMDGGSKVIAYQYTARETTVRGEAEDNCPLTITAEGGPRLVDAMGITRKLDREGGDAANVKVASFVEDTAEEPGNLEAGSTLKELFGKIRRWFAALGKLAFKDKVAQSDFEETLNTAFNNKVDKVNGKGLSTEDFTTAFKNKLNNIANNANNYTHPSSAAGAKKSDLYKITTDANGHVTGSVAVAKSDITALGIPGEDTVYIHPTTAGNKHIPAGGSSGQYLKYSTAGTAAWASPASNTASSSAAGFMSAADKTKLDAIEAGAQVNPAFATTSGVSSIPSTTDGLYQTGASNSGSHLNSLGTSNTVARGDHKHSLSIPNASTSKPGLMSKTDKANLNNLMNMRIVGLYQFNSSGGLYSSYGMAITCTRNSTTDPVTNKTVDCYKVTLNGGNSSKAYYAIIIPGIGYTGSVGGRCAGQQSINVVLYKAGTNTATLANSGMLVLIETA